MVSDKISIIVPVYNVSEYLNRCLDSIAEQSYTNFEAILIDDKSTDNSFKICQEYAKKDKRFILIKNDINKGLGLTRNEGLKKASGTYVVFVDSDDYIEKNMLENLYNVVVKTKADTVIAGYKRCRAGRETIEKNRYQGQVFEGNLIRKEILAKMFGQYKGDNIEMSVWKTLFSMEIIKSDNIVFPDRKYISEDIIFDIKYFKNANRVAMSGDTSYCYCYNVTSLTQQYNPYRFELVKFQVNEMRRMAGGIKNYNNCSLRIDSYLLGNTIHHIKTYVKHSNIINKDKCISGLYKICSDNIFYNFKWENIKYMFGIKERIICFLIMKKRVKLLFWYVKIIVMLREITRW